MHGKRRPVLHTCIPVKAISSHLARPIVRMRPLVGFRKNKQKSACNPQKTRVTCAPFVAACDNNDATSLPMKTFLHIAKPSTSREHRDAACCALRNAYARLLGMALTD